MRVYVHSCACMGAHIGMHGLEHRHAWARTWACMGMQRAVWLLTQICSVTHCRAAGACTAVPERCRLGVLPRSGWICPGHAHAHICRSRGPHLRYETAVIRVDLPKVEVTKIQEALPRRMVHLEEARAVAVEALARYDAGPSRVLRQPALDVQHHGIEDEPHVARGVGSYDVTKAVDPDALCHLAQPPLAVLQQRAARQHLRGLQGRPTRAVACARVVNLVGASGRTRRSCSCTPHTFTLSMALIHPFTHHTSIRHHTKHHTSHMHPSMQCYTSHVSACLSRRQQAAYKAPLSCPLTPARPSHTSTPLQAAPRGAETTAAAAAPARAPLRRLALGQM